ncbi:MAG TPA: hypothetical protein VJ302_28070 [Blastocatellia bacterium]|nr:hypothetical protein [Blastocatellia bacterium]
MFKSVLVGILCLLVPGLALAQGEAGGGPKRTLETNVFFAHPAGPPTPVTGAPYSAQAVTKSVQVLADGNRITRTNSENVARDSQGRTRQETSPFKTNTDAPVLIIVNDPVAGYTYTLDSKTKTAFKLPALKGAPPEAGMAVRGQMMHVEFGEGGAPHGAIRIMTQSGPPEGPDANETKTDLGTQTIEGVTAQGTRITRTIPAGEVGNEKPIVTTIETWYSPDLKVPVMSKTVDPHLGEITYRLTNLQRSEPAASLFQIPSDYTVKEGPSRGPFIHQLRGPKDSIQ